MKKGDDKFVFGLSTIGERGQIVIPSSIRRQLKIGHKDKVIVLLTPAKSIVIIPVKKFKKVLGKIDKSLNILRKIN